MMRLTSGEITCFPSDLTSSWDRGRNVGGKCTPLFRSAAAATAVCIGVTEMPCPKEIVMAANSFHFGGSKGAAFSGSSVFKRSVKPSRFMNSC